MFESEYKKLNKAQKEVVDNIDGPVMVVAGPGTGKTQVLALRIANILLKTDIKADSILCLTFTNSGVRAMRERLRKYTGVESAKVYVSTFHSFGMDIVERYFNVLGLEKMPKIMDDRNSVSLCDGILEENTWEHIRPRADTARYFKDLKSLISILKRERIISGDFGEMIKKEISDIKNDPENISTRGSSKGELKKEAENKIEGLARTLETVKFYELYEKAKKEQYLFDYDDVLESLVKIVEESEDAVSFIREQYQYVLIDEHQDSSLIQNEFLQKVWGDIEKPNIFVVGDDRQLIYGFSGASLEYFENFKNTFGKAKLISLIENYRSTSTILDFAHLILESSMNKEKLKSNHKENHPIKLIEASYERDEILVCALEIKKKLKEGIDPNEMAILVPKNRQVKSAVAILDDLDIPVSSRNKINFFHTDEAQAMIQVLKVLANPSDNVYFANSFFNKFSDIPPLSAHKYIAKNKMRDFSISNTEDESPSLFEENKEIKSWINKFKSWINIAGGLNVYELIQTVGSEFLLDTAKDHKALVLRIEVLRTFLHLALFEIEKNHKINLIEFLTFLDRLESYGEELPLAVFGEDTGVKVLTLHGSKGLEFDFVWVAHLDEKSLSDSKRSVFVLPEILKEKIEQKDEAVLRRELYVAITRAKRFCTFSYSTHSYTGADLNLVGIILNLEENLEKQNSEETERLIMQNDPKLYIEKQKSLVPKTSLEKLKKLVAKDFVDKRVSVSLLNNFFECPWKWYFRNLLQLPEPSSDSLQFGNIVHKSVDDILKLHRMPNDTEVKNIVAKNIKIVYLADSKKEERYIDEVFKIVSSWAKNRLSKISENHESEQSVSVADDRFPHLSIYGKIDLIEILPASADGNKKDVSVTDFKTGNPRKKSDIEKVDEEGRMSDYMRQLAMYSYLLNKNQKWNKNVVESKLEFLEAKNGKDAFYKCQIDKEQIDLLVRDITDYESLISKGEWVDRPCHFKSYGKANTICEYCKMSKIYLV